MLYVPKPIDTGSVELPAELGALVEQLAENAHDIWAQKRLSQGWTYGPRRDDDQKTHPCLVPYGDLPPDEADYDRAVVTGVIKAALALGFHICRDKLDGNCQAGEAKR